MLASLCGIILGLYALFIMDTTVETIDIIGTTSVRTSRVNNIGLMNKQQNFLIFSCTISIVGALFFLLGDGAELTKSKYYEYFDLARINELNGNTDIAISNYNACLYYLENHNTDGVLRSEAQEKIKKKIQNLGGEVKNTTLFYNLKD